MGEALNLLSKNQAEDQQVNLAYPYIVDIIISTKIGEKTFKEILAWSLHFFDHNIYKYL